MRTIPFSGAFRRELLPPPATFYAQELGKLSRPNRNWAKGLCPFHDDHHPSLSVNLVTGAFRCFSCEAAGGDVVAFLMQRDRLTFPQAAHALGAWSGDTCRPGATHDHLREYCERRRSKAEYDAQLEAARRRRLEIRDWLHLLERVNRKASTRLSEIRSGTPEQYEGETEVLWGILADTLDLSRMAAAEYGKLAGVAVGE